MHFPSGRLEKEDENEQQDVPSLHALSCHVVGRLFRVIIGRRIYPRHNRNINRNIAFLILQLSSLTVRGVGNEKALACYPYRC
jgi:hypothetical protein